MNKTELVVAVAEQANMSKANAKAAVDAVLAAITEDLKAGNKVSIPGFGTFSVTERAARDGRNPRTGEAIRIEASKSVSFHAGATLKSEIK